LHALLAARLTPEAPDRPQEAQRVTTYTPMLWAVLDEDARYQEYVRVLSLLARQTPEASSAPAQEPIRRALQTLVDKLDTVHADPRYQSVWSLYAIHGGHYTEPRYEHEFKAAKEALAASTGTAPQGWQPLPESVTLVSDVIQEVFKAAVKFPEWPTRGTDAAAIVGEESGELQQAVLQATYEGGSIEAVRKEAIQTAAMAIQFLLNLSDTRFDRGEQTQKRLPSPPPEPTTGGTK